MVRLQAEESGDPRRIQSTNRRPFPIFPCGRAKFPFASPLRNVAPDSLPGRLMRSGALLALRHPR